MLPGGALQKFKLVYKTKTSQHRVKCPVELLHGFQCRMAWNMVLELLRGSRLTKYELRIL